MQVFTSWSGSSSKAVATELRSFVPNVLQHVSLFVSDKDIAVGTRWNDEIAVQLQDCGFGIVVVTPENVGSQWLHFEAGALAKAYQTAHVCPLLVRMEPRDLSGPLSSFQAITTSRTDLLNLVRTINEASNPPLDDDRLSQSFELHWTSFCARLETAMEAPVDAPEPPSRDADDILGEIVERLRSIERAVEPSPLPLFPAHTEASNRYLNAISTVYPLNYQSTAKPPIPQYAKGERVSHPTWGHGVAVRQGGELVVVRFEGADKAVAISASELTKAD